MARNRNEPVSNETPSEEDRVTIDEDSIGEAADLVAEPEEVPEANSVLYLGVFADRRISKEEWEQAGVPDQEGSVWTESTGKVLSISDFNEQALAVLAGTGEFRITRSE